MGKPSQSGSVTQTTVNPTQQAQLPFLQSGWQNAQNLYNNNPLQYYPGQTLANFNPFVASGYNDIGSIAPTVNSIIRDPANALFNSATQGGMGATNSPAYPWLSAILGGATSPQAAITDAANHVYNLGNQAAATAQNGSGVGSILGSIGNMAGASSNNGYAGMLANLGLGGIDGLPSAQNLIGAAGNSANSPNNVALNTLAKEAQGAFLNKNPYIDAEYGAASRPVVNAYQTATAPQTDSNYEASGRYGGGALLNARSQNEQNLGKSLGDLSANLYGQDYANERNLMQGAQSTLGSLVNQGLGIQLGAGEALGNLGLGEFGARTNALNAAGNQYLSGLGQGIGALGTLGGLQQNEFGLRNQALNIGGSLLGQSGALNGANLNALSGAANTLQNSYDTGNLNSLRALGMEPNVLAQNFAGDNAMVQAGQGLTGLDQAQIQDQMQRFYGNQNAPYQTLQQYLNFIGQPTNGSNSITTPLLSNPLASAFQTLGGLNSALGPNGLGLTGGSGGGGILGSGGLFGAGGLFGTDGLLGASSVGPSIDALNSAGLASAGLSEAPFAAGSSILPDFLPFLGA